MDDDWFRRMTAYNAAHAALIPILLSLAMRHLSPEEARALGNEIIRNTSNTDAATGVTRGDEIASERYADIAVQSLEHIKELVNAAVATVGSAPRGQGW